MDKKKSDIKQPKTKDVAKVPVVMQLEALECGAASLAMILAYYDKWVPLEVVRKDCGVSRDGSNAKNVLMAARNYGLIAHGYRFEPETLKENGHFPCIVHWEFNHFVVVNGFKKGKVYINDPARGNIVISEEDFDNSFTGITLMFEPGENFEPGGQKKSMFEFVKRRVKGEKVSIIFVIATTILASLVGIIKPGVSRVFLDRMLGGKYCEWNLPFMAFVTVLTLIEVINVSINAIYTLRINGKLAADGNISYVDKIMHLPMEFFSQRGSGDILTRKETNATIAETLINVLAPLVINTGMMVFYLVVMLRYSVALSMVGILSIFINYFVARIVSDKRVNITRVLMRDEGSLASVTIAGIEMIDTIKSSGAENGYFAKWSGIKANVNSGEVKYNKLNAYLGNIPTIVNSLSSSVILLLGSYFAITEDFTTGSIMAFSSILTSFVTPASSIITAGQSITEMRTQMERVDDVLKYPDDESYACDDNDDRDDISYAKLRGEIEIKNLTFGYSRLAEPVIKDFNMHLHPGKSVAIVGASGCGKSTITKLISGLYSPWSGSITFDGKERKDIPKSVMSGSLAVVDQDIIVFDDTISENIKMWDDTIQDFEVILAARDANIHSDIMERAEGYDRKLSEGGKDLSGGQRQRLEIARVLALDPTIIIMDEATSALDAKTEYDVVRSIRERGITCIVVAHRLSTIRDCDEIIVLDDGVVVERGTHEELYSKDGCYKKLVTSD